jgi:hypothetical protein
MAINFVFVLNVETLLSMTSENRWNLTKNIALYIELYIEKWFSLSCLAILLKS